MFFMLNIYHLNNYLILSFYENNSYRNIDNIIKIFKQLNHFHHLLFLAFIIADILFVNF